MDLSELYEELAANDLDGRCLGVIEPSPDGSWRWPFSWMDVGDSFYVAHFHRQPEKVRNYAKLRGYELGYRFKVTANSDVDEHAKVTRVEKARRIVQEDISYDAMRKIIHYCYGVQIDNFGWGAEPLVCYRPQLRKPRQMDHVMKYSTASLYEVLLFADRIETRPVELGTTVSELRMKKYKDIFFG